MKSHKGGGRGGGYGGGKQKRGGGRGGGRRRGGGGRGGRHPPGLTGPQIGMWYRNEGIRDKIKREREQRQEVNMSASREKHITDMLKSFSDPSSSLDQPGTPSSSKMGTFQDDNFWRKPLVKNDEESSEKLMKDFIKKTSDSKYIRMQEFRKKLPSYKMKDEIVQLISSNQVVVISGETGCGKTTQVAQFILDDAIMRTKGSTCRVVCTQPRRISAITIAERVAEERGETVGCPGSTGYQIRLESQLPRENGSIVFCTTGVILRWLTSDPDLTSASHVIIDEIHERSTHSDFLLIVIRDVLRRRPDLKVVLMSATLNAEMFSRYFNNCPMLNIPGFTFPVQQHFLEEVIQVLGYKCDPPAMKRPGMYRRGYGPRGEEKRRQEEMWTDYLRLVESRVKDRSVVECLKNMDFEKIDYCLVEQLLTHIALKKEEGAILVFLPGWKDISILHENLKKNRLFSSDKFLILPLHSLMPTANQRQIFDKPPQGVRKIVLSTNLAETSITIDDVVYVVDCGKTKEMNFDVDKELATLLSVWVSKASSIQRKGRAGRVQQGTCFHLFTQFHYERMLDYQQPEILRTPLEEICLQVKSLKLGMVEPFLSKALEPPLQKAIEQAIATLVQLNAFDHHENLTPLGYHLARLPVHPRIGKIILFGAIMSCLDPVLTIASAMGYRDPYVVPFGKEKQADECRKTFSPGTQSDHLTLYEAFKKWESANRHGNAYQFCRDNFLSHSVLQLINNMKTQFAEHLRDIGFITSSDPKQEAANYNSDNETLIKAILCAGFYPNVISVTRQFPDSSRPPWLHIQQDGRRVRVNIHPKSVNSSESSFDTNCLIYFEKVKSTSINIHDCSVITPYALLFFGGEISLSLDEDQEIVTVDDWIKFNCRQSVATLVQRLRDELDRLLEEMIRRPHLTLTLKKNSSEDRQSMLIRAIIDLITSEKTESYEV